MSAPKLVDRDRLNTDLHYRVAYNRDVRPVHPSCQYSTH